MTVPRRYFFCGSFMFLFCLVFAMSVRVCLYVLCGHLLGKGWPLGSCLWCLLWDCHFPIGILGQVWYLIVSIPDLCTFTYFVCGLWLRYFLIILTYYFCSNWNSVLAIATDMPKVGTWMRTIYRPVVQLYCCASPRTQCMLVPRHLGSIRSYINIRPCVHASFKSDALKYQNIIFFFQWKCKTGEPSIVALLIKTIYTWRVAQDWLKAGLKQDENILESRARWRLKSLPWRCQWIQRLSVSLVAGSTVGYLTGRRNLCMYWSCKYGTLYFYWWPLVAAPKSWRCGEAGIATMACTIRNIIMALACCLLCWRVSHKWLSVMAVTLLV